MDLRNDAHQEGSCRLLISSTHQLAQVSESRRNYDPGTNTNDHEGVEARGASITRTTDFGVMSLSRFLGQESSLSAWPQLGYTIPITKSTKAHMELSCHSPALMSL
ncbi:hypothetical protein N7447_005384 [Penicillium robsamsonii]|uniref:uncharacterized protein n=1 Tax=Penicillium robsamsonii TaxID=1792511 RepID=UPI0025499227|nr:uncharacterized protein N7447_005384 [Penicillium robsamsonii]KAJ5823044.1 hypothetical protein N7447_005384 [Penicillium robsamsonii]